jgi:hypothetical protein
MLLSNLHRPCSFRAPSSVRINYFAIPGTVRSIERRKPRGNHLDADQDKVRE